MRSSTAAVVAVAVLSMMMGERIHG